MFAKLILNSVDYGIHIFIVPLRDPETGQCLPGVSCGDLVFEIHIFLDDI